MEPLDRLRQEFITLNKVKKATVKNSLDRKPYITARSYYNAMRLFCLDCELVSFNDIELMEDEINHSF
jgi:hypothetical protein